jgi:hypothetical protein
LKIICDIRVLTKSRQDNNKQDGARTDNKRPKKSREKPGKNREKDGKQENTRNKETNITGKRQGNMEYQEKP